MIGMSMGIILGRGPRIKSRLCRNRFRSVLMGMFFLRKNAGRLVLLGMKRGW